MCWQCCLYANIYFYNVINKIGEIRAVLFWGIAFCITDENERNKFVIISKYIGNIYIKNVKSTWFIVTFLQK